MFRPPNGSTFSRKPREPTLSVSHKPLARFVGCDVLLGSLGCATSFQPLTHFSLNCISEIWYSVKIQIGHVHIF